jgi:hypothetical protein
MSLQRPDFIGKFVQINQNIWHVHVISAQGVINSMFCEHEHVIMDT